MSLQSPKDLYLLITDKDGKQRVSDHRVWDEEAFLATATHNHAKEGNTIAKISEKTYKEFKGHKSCSM